MTTTLNPSLAKARPNVIPLRAEKWLVAGLLLATMLVPFLGKYQTGDALDVASPLVEVIWSLLYLVAGVRLRALRDQARLLFPRTLPLLGFLALMMASSLWSVEATTFKRAIELIGTTTIGYYIVARFTLRELLDMLVLAFGVAAVLSVAVIFGAPAHGRMDFGSGPWTGLFQEKNNLGAAMALGGLSLLVLLFERTARPQPAGSPAASRPVNSAATSQPANSAASRPASSEAGSHTVSPRDAASPEADSRPTGSQVHGFSGEPNDAGKMIALAGLSVLLSPLTLFEWLGRRRALLLGTFGLVVALLAGSRSATSIGAFGIVTIFLVTAWACTSPKYGAAARILTVLGALLAGTVWLALGLSPDSIFDAAGRETNLTGRTDFWPYLQQAISERPLLGYGYDAFFGSQLGKDTLSYYVVEAGGWTPYHAHNSFLQILLDSGYVGLCAFGLVLVCALWQAIAYAWRERSRTALWPLAILLYLLAGSFTETYFRSFNTIEWVVFVTAVLYPLRPKPADTPLAPELGDFTSRGRLRRSWSDRRTARDRETLRETA